MLRIMMRILPKINYVIGSQNKAQFIRHSIYNGNKYLLNCYRGYKTVLCSQPAQQNSGQYSIGHFHQRLIR